MNEKEIISVINAVQFLDFNKMEIKDKTLLMLALIDFADRAKPIILKYGIKEFIEKEA